VCDENLRKPETRITLRNQKSPSTRRGKFGGFVYVKAIIRAEGAEKFGRFA
jgi:hypothetical protein